MINAHNPRNYMKNHLLICLLLFSSIAFPQNNFQKLDTLLNNAAQLNLFSGVVLVADKDSVPYLKTYGYADWDNLTPNLADTKFNIGSIGKLFTQIIIMQLVQEGKLKLTGNLAGLCPVYHNKYDKEITIQMLLTFSAGLGDYLQLRDFRNNPEKYRNIKDLTELISREPLLFEPGTSKRYSNSGYVVLGAVMEKLTGKTYVENLKERILEPLKMDHSGFIYTDEKTENTAKGFIVSPAGKKMIAGPLPRVPTSAGGMYSDAGDLLKLDRSLMNDNILLGDKYKALLMNKFDESSGETWKQMKASPDFGIGVAGGSPGWNAVYDQNVAGGYTVIILSNFDKGAEVLAGRINDILNDRSYSPLQPGAGSFIYNKIKEKGIDDFLENYKEYLSAYKFDNDAVLNTAGYQLLNEGYVDEAVAVFIVNTKYFPGIANTYDSLGEAYAAKGDKENAIKNYKKSLELNPANKNAEQMIKQLEGGN
jgi:CubicO group peptidase (beta-lactamase class C family)